MFYGRNDAKAETPVLWPPHAKSWLIGKDSDAGRDWGQEEKGMTEDEMAGWHHRPDGHESQWTLGVGDGQEGLVCCDSWGRKESDTTEQRNWTEQIERYFQSGLTWELGSSYILFTRDTSKVHRRLKWEGGRTIWQKTGMALLIILNKIDLKKSFSLLSPIFLLVSSVPISIRLLWQQVTESALTSLSTTPNYILFSIVKSSQNREGGGRLGQGSPRQRNSLAKFGPDQ